MRAARLEIDVQWEAILQIDILVNKTWLIEGVAGLIALNIPRDILVVDELDMLNNKT